MAESATEEQRAGFEELLDFIKRNRGFDFTGYKRPTLSRRIEKRMQAVGVETYADYRDFLEANSDEYVALFDTILINVTSFFRDPPTWDYVAQEIVPSLADALAGDDGIRVWSTGCASGEEAYTVAMVLAEGLGDDVFRVRVKIYATDLDEEALGHARQGRYDAKAIEPVPEELRQKYFERLDGKYAFRADLRRTVIFGLHDLLQDPPISRIDLLLARNTLMYFQPDAQSRILSSFHFSLNQRGFLVLGKSEVLLTRSNLFVPLDLKRRVFKPTPKVAFRDRLLDFVHDGPDAVQAPERGGQLRDSAAETAAFAQFVIDNRGTLALANLQARFMFGLTQRDLGRPFQNLELSYRPLELRSRIEDASREGQPLLLHDVEVQSASGESRFFDVHLAPLLGTDGRQGGMAITFTDVSRHRQLQMTLEQAKGELETAYEELQSTAEELETTNEELQSTNEELETTNEELQSTNEELETMNDELRQRTDDLNHVNLFLDSILTSLHAGVAVLDGELRIQAWNAQAEELWGVRAEEAQGEHFLNIDIGLPVSRLADLLRKSLSGAEDGFNEVVLPATNRRGKSIECRVNVSPLVGPPEDIRGVIVLMEAS